MKNFENEIHYKDEGEQLLEPSIMVEPMYAVARSMLHRNVKQDCIIKENDVIKFGRARFKVSEVSILERDKDIREQKSKMAKRQAAWEQTAKRKAKK